MSMFTRGRAAFAAATVALTMLTGCGVVDDSSGRKAETRTMTDAIQKELSTQPGVVAVEAGYDNQLDLSAHGWVDITVKPGADNKALIQEALRAIWQSKLNPLSTVRVNIKGTDGATGDSEDFDVSGVTPEGATTKADLEKKYGPHPAG